MTATTLIVKLEGLKLSPSTNALEMMVRQEINNALNRAITIVRQHEAEQITAVDYEEVLADHRRLVRELDIALNGEGGAAKQASLCDLVSQVRAMRRSSTRDGEADEAFNKVNHALCLAARINDSRPGALAAREALVALTVLKPQAAEVCGIRVVNDPTAPSGELRLRDRRGKIVSKIITSEFEKS